MNMNIISALATIKKAINNGLITDEYVIQELVMNTGAYER